MALPVREIRAHYASGQWKGTTLLDVLVSRVETAPDRVAMVDASGTLTNQQVLEALGRVVDLLRSHGVDEGVPIIVQLPNSIVFAISNLAINASGAAIVPITHSMRASEVVAVAERVGSSVIVASASRTDHVAELTGAGLQVLTDRAIQNAIVGSATSSWSPADASSDPDTVLDLMFTSGTTGQPKGIINTTNTKLSALRGMIRELDLGPDDTWLVVPPMAHNAGWLYSLLPALLSGATAVFQERFDAQVTLDLIEQEQVRALFLTPTHAGDVLGCVDAGGVPPTSLRYVVIGGAATSVEIKTRLRRSLGAEVVSMYGCTENQGVTFVRPGTPPEIADRTVGQACPGVEIAIFDEDRTTRMPPGIPGLIASLGPGTFAGYFDDQVATDAAFNADGWFFPGDIGHLDATGALTLTGRQKEIIIRGGHNIVPEDVELALAGHPSIAEVAAVGIPDERLGERVCAVVVGDASLDLASVVNYLREQGIGSHVWPEALMIVDAFPRTDIGKVRRGELRSQAVRALNRGELVVAKGSEKPL